MSQRKHLTGETLAKFDALDNMKTVRRTLLPEDDLSVDSAGLLAVHTPLNEPAVQMDKAIGTGRDSGAAKNKTPDSRTVIQRAQPWTKDPARLWIVGLTCVIAAGLLTFLILLLTGSL